MSKNSITVRAKGGSLAFSSSSIDNATKLVPLSFRETTTVDVSVVDLRRLLYVIRTGIYLLEEIKGIRTLTSSEEVHLRTMTESLKNFPADVY